MLRPLKKFLIRSIAKASNTLLTEHVVSIVRRIAVSLALLSFILFILIVYLHRNKMVSFAWPSQIPYNYFFSVYIAFTFILFYEVFAMIIAIPGSIADSIGKQYEIMSLIILRTVFEHVGQYKQSLLGMTMVENLGDINVQQILSIEELLVGAFGSILLFYLIRIYFKHQRHTKILEHPEDIEDFLTIKRIVSLSLIIVLFFVAIEHVFQLCQSFDSGGIHEVKISHIFFKDMFSVMIFIDILFVFISTWYSPNYYVVFRNSGMTVSTVVLRLSFTSSLTISVLLATLAVVVGIFMTLIYNQFQKEKITAGE